MKLLLSLLMLGWAAVCVAAPFPLDDFKQFISNRPTVEEMNFQVRSQQFHYDKFKDDETAL